MQQSLSDLRQLRLDRAGDRHCVPAGLLRVEQRDRGPSVEERGRAHLFRIVHDLADVARFYKEALARGDNDIVELIRIADSAERANAQLARASAGQTAGKREVLRANSDSDLAGG